MADPSANPEEPAPPDAEELVAYLDGELDAATAERVETRLGLDSSARAQADAYKRTWELLDYLPRPQPSPSFTHRTLERVEAISGSRAMKAMTGTSAPAPVARRGRWAAALGWAACFLLAVAAGYGARSALAPKPAPSKPEPVDAQLLSDLPVLENYRLYRQVDDLEYLRSLDQPDLFGDER
jgi:anti-sigma factor RsiW